MTPDEYQQAVGELAHSSRMPDDVAANIEARLIEALGEVSGEPAPPRRPVSYTALAAAAALVITAGVGSWYAWRHIAVSEVMPAPHVNARSDAPVHQSDRVHLPPPETLRRTSVAAIEAGHADRRRAKKLPPVIRPSGFVPVPTAAGLPGFESGAIVRMSFPVTALPSFGLDITPTSGDRPVEADVLVGQDGLARAIRLVNTSRSQQ